MISGIYKWTNPKGRVYIGQAEDLLERKEDYKCPSTIKAQRRIYNSIIFYGIEAHVWSIQEYCSIEDLNRRERYWQDFYDVLSPMGMNCVLQEADGKRRIFSEETKKKLSISNKGKKRADETKKKNSLANIGKKKSLETKNKMSNSQKGRKHSQETKDKMKKSKTGIPIHSKESISKIVQKTSKPVIQYDLQGNFIKEWKSAREIERCLGINYKYISACCRETRSNTCGFIWKFKNKEELELIKETKDEK